MPTCRMRSALFRVLCYFGSGKTKQTFEIISVTFLYGLNRSENDIFRINTFLCSISKHSRFAKQLISRSSSTFSTAVAKITGEMD